MSLSEFTRSERKKMKEPFFTVKELKPIEDKKKPKPIGTGSRRMGKKQQSLAAKLKNQSYYQLFPTGDHTMQLVQHDPLILKKYNN
jgi:hypothetical protein